MRLGASGGPNTFQKTKPEVHMSDPHFDATHPGRPFGSHGGHGFDPNQPRVPAGHSDGGQWTNKPGGGSALRREAVVDRSGKETWGSFANAFRADGTPAEQRVFNRDGSRIVSEFNDGSRGRWDERHTVVTRDHSKVVVIPTRRAYSLSRCDRESQ
jgi:hypothetical protein